MKTTQKRRFYIIVALFTAFTWNVAFSQCSTCSQGKVKVRFYCRADGVHTTILGGKTASGNSGGGFSTNNDGSFHNNGYSSSPIKVAELQLDKTYTLTSSGDVGCYHILLGTDSCYEIKINGEENQLIENLTFGAYNESFNVVISKRKPKEGREGGNGGGGSGTGGINDGLLWEWPLGGAGAGTDAGSLQLLLSNLVASSYTPAALTQTLANDQVETILIGQVIRQVLAPEILADVVTVDADTFELRFYLVAQVGPKNGSGHYTVTGPPLVVWRVELPSGGIIGQDFSIKEIKDGVTIPNDFTYTPASQTWTASLGSIRDETQTTTTLGNGDLEVLTTVTHPTSGAVVSQTKEIRRNFEWGIEVISRVEDPNGAALTTQYAFHTEMYLPNTNPPQLSGSYSRLKSVIYPTGDWEKYEYFSDNVPDTAVSARSGMIKFRMRPWLDLPASPESAVASNPASPEDMSTGNCRVTAYHYDGFGSIAHQVTRQEEYVLGKMIGKIDTPSEDDTITFSDTTHSTQTSEKRHSGYLGSIWPTSGRLISTQTETGKNTAWTYDRGIFNSTTRSFTPDPGGWALQSIADDSYGSPATLLTNRSLRNVSVVDDKGLKAYEETLVYDGSAYQLLTRMDYFHDSEGRLVRQEKDGRILREQTWSDGRLLTETDEAGIVTTFSGFDTQDRPTIVTRSGVTTTTTFDPLGRARVITQSGESLTLSQTTEYDVAGRVMNETDVNGLPTSYHYSPNGRITTVTHPNGSTTITETHLDGQVKSVTGTATVPEFHQRSVDPITGFITTRIYQGTDLSPRWTQTTTNWVGNTVSESVPGQTSLQTTTQTYNDLGLLASTTRSGMATELFEYDQTGMLFRQGLDLNANGILDPSSVDRLSETTNVYALEVGVWYQVNTLKTWLTNNNATPTTLQTTKQQITGLTTSTLSNIASIDDQNQPTLTVETVDRTLATVTRTTTFPGTENPQIEITTNGRLLSRQSPGSSAPVSFQYDGLGRQKTTTDPRTSTIVETRLYHPSTDQLASITTPAGTTTYQWYPTTHSNAGQLAVTTNPDTTTVRQAYNPRGQPTRTWGSASCPVEWTYDTYGQMQSTRTFQTEHGWNGTEWPATVTGGSLTQWHYHEPSGVLEAKEDAATESVTYSHAVIATGRTKTRTWARVDGATPLATTSTYDLAGNLVSVTYSDATPPVTITPDRTGRAATITDAAGTRSLTYTTNGQLSGEAYTAGLLSGHSYARDHDAQSRLISLNWTLGGSSLVSQSYTYSPATGRLNAAVDGPISVTNRYIPNSDLNQGPEFRHNGNLRMTTTRTYDPASRLLSIASTRPNASAHSSTAYQFDAASRRKKATAADGTAWHYDYNDRGELDSASRKWPTGSTIDGQQFAQTYDAIGNLLTTTTNGRPATYTPNNLNQYDQRTVPPTIDILGTANPSATVTVNQTPTTRNPNGYFFAPLPVNNSSSAVWQDIRILGVKNFAGPNASDAVAEQSGRRFLPKSPELFTHDEDGNLTQDGRWDYTWDAENRLIKMETRSTVPVSMPRLRIENTYDYQHRRVRKVVRLLNPASGTWTVQSDTRNLYDGGWNLLAEVNASGTLLRSYLWGHDLSGTFTGAGGVGGLLAINLTPTLDTTNAGTYFPAFDGNGNVLSLTKATDGTVAASYEYGPFGQLLRATGPAAPLNPIRFSTKYEDRETGLLYFSFRYYSPEMGRWLSRDPIEEKGGINLYGMCRNDPVNKLDYLGLAPKKPIKIAMLGLNPSQGNPNMIDGHPQFRSANPDHMFTSRSTKRAFDAILNHFDLDGNGKLDKCDSPPFKVRLVGYSWGGWSALIISHDLDSWKALETKSDLELAVGTIDPVSTARRDTRIGWFGNRFNAQKPSKIKVVRAVNYYQQNGIENSLPDSLFKGESVSWATPNTDVSSESGMMGTARLMHMGIVVRYGERVAREIFNVR